MDLTDASFGEAVFAPQHTVLVEFWAPSQGRASIQERLAVLEQLAALHADKIRVLRLDVEQNPVAPLVYGVRRVPVAILFRGGEELGRWDASTPLADVVSRLVSGGSVP